MQPRTSTSAIHSQENRETSQCSNALSFANAEKWMHKLGLYKKLLLVEKELQKIAHQKVCEIEDELRRLTTDNPNNTLKIQENALTIARNALTETKNKTTIGTVETTAMSVCACAVTVILAKFALPDLMLALTTFKMTAVSIISSVVGSSGYIGWRSDKKASLDTKMAEDNVKASETAVNKCKIRCSEHAKQLQLKSTEKPVIYRNLEDANASVETMNATIRNIEFYLRQSEKLNNPKLSTNKNITFSAPREAQDQLDPTVPIHTNVVTTQPSKAL